MTGSKAASERRMGPPGSANWQAMLDGAEEILREEGHAQLTSRRIAERIGVKQRLVYYYFRTMDELIVALFRRLSERALARLGAAAESPQALREIWDTHVGGTDARLISEFMALAHRIPDLRAEVIRFIEHARAIETRVLEAALARSGRESPIPPAALALIATSVALSMSREAQLGVATGHRELTAVIDGFIAGLQS